MLVNLNENFRPFGAGNVIPNFWNFPSKCEIGVKLPEYDYKGKNVRLTARLNSSHEILKFLLLTDALKNQRVSHIDVYLSYLPYARQDRLMDNGESFSLRAFANILNAQNYRHIEIFDPHSDVATALILNSVGRSNYRFVAKALERIQFSDYLLICPDAGAYKKIWGLACHLSYKDEIVVCNKVRDVTTGKIVEYRVPSDVNIKGRDCVIVDDICSKGGTFMLLAEKLKERGARTVTLIVSHYEDSASILDLSENIDTLYTTNSFVDNHGVGFINEIPLTSEIW